MNILLNTLLKEGLITEEQLSEARTKQLGAKKPVQQLLVEMGFVSSLDLKRVSSKIFQMPVVELDKEVRSPEALKVLSYETVKQFGVFPLRRNENSLVVAMSDPDDVVTIDDIRRITGLDVEPILATEEDISKNIEKHYQSDDSLYDVLKNVQKEATISFVPQDTGTKTVSARIGEKEGPVSKLVNLFISDAIEVRASDIHIEPHEGVVRVRYRVDGDLRNVMDIAKAVYPAAVARIKVMTDMDLAESRKPQDGRARISCAGREIDLRVSVVPTHFGEKIVFRILDPQAARLAIEDTGMEADDLALFKEACKQPQGIILVTGPTGSGKTSTLYGALSYIKNESKNIVTVEDPVEYTIEGVNQIQVNPGQGFTFAAGLRSILRQDPDIILVGEIRDAETARIAFRSSQTGHLVFSTLHTNSAAATVSRLRDIGLESYLIGSSLNMIIAQRLLKRICPHCKEQCVLDGPVLEIFKESISRRGIKTFYKGKGCIHCSFTGYHSRAAIFEILTITKKIKALIVQGAGERQIIEEASKEGFRGLLEAGIDAAQTGITTFDELNRVIGAGETALEEEKPVSGPSGEPSVSSQIKVLTVDDENHILMMLKTRLEACGYRIIQAHNGKEAIEAAVKEKPDIIIMDIMMPEMDGIQATKILRSRLETSVIPILMLTAKKDVRSEIEGLDAGADDYMGKPFDGARLIARVKMLLRRNTPVS